MGALPEKTSGSDRTKSRSSRVSSRHYSKGAQMKRGFFIGAIALMLVAFTIATAGEKSDFSGKWMMDTAKSKGVPAGMDQILIISQQGDRLMIQTKIYPENTPNIIQNDDYTLDGKENAFT